MYSGLLIFVLSRFKYLDLYELGDNPYIVKLGLFYPNQHICVLAQMKTKGEVGTI